MASYLTFCSLEFSLATRVKVAHHQFFYTNCKNICITSSVALVGPFQRLKKYLGVGLKPFQFPERAEAFQEKARVSDWKSRVLKKWTWKRQRRSTERLYLLHYRKYMSQCYWSFTHSSDSGYLSLRSWIWTIPLKVNLSIVNYTSLWKLIINHWSVPWNEYVNFVSAANHSPATPKNPLET